MSRLPDEFMRGGGCFAPDAHVVCSVRSEGGAEEEALVRIDELHAGALVRTASGGTARVRCVVQSPTDEGLALPLCLQPGPRPRARGARWRRALRYSRPRHQG